MCLYWCSFDIFCVASSWCVYHVLYLIAECHCYRCDFCNRVVYHECEKVFMVVEVYCQM